MMMQRAQRITLDTPAAELPTVTKALCGHLQSLGIETVNDLIFYLPFRYEDYARMVPIADVRDGMQASVKGTIELIAHRHRRRGRGTITELILKDGSGRLKITCFNQPYLSKVFARGQEVVIAGRARLGPLGIQFINPTIEKSGAELVHAGRIVPVYPSTAGVTQRNLRFLIKKALVCASEAADWMPKSVCASYHLMHMQDALRTIHFPENHERLKSAQRRFAFQELFLLQVYALMRRRARAEMRAAPMPLCAEKVKQFVRNLPFALTKDQKIAAWQIFKDMERAEPMNRMVQGDVGSGKTVVGAMACLEAHFHGMQSAWLAPTEILARQHFDTLRALYAPRASSMAVALCTASTRLISATDGAAEKISRKELYARIASGKIALVIGTHALLQSPIAYTALALIIVDEQHRFGVAQRHALTLASRAQGYAPHFLSMTATPIPRSLALAFYGDLSVSTIKTMPSGRRTVVSRVVSADKRAAAYQFIRAQVLAGRQAFVVCPLIEPGMNEQTAAFGYNERKAVLDEYKRLHEQVFPDLKLSMLHGKLKAEEKDRIRSSFARGEIDMLVSTTVVEVGIDVPNASVMVIEGADRFGLAQLHQLRGRVGRSSHQSYCLLFADAASERARERLDFFVQTTDGFKLAEQDLLWRGKGEIYGTAQSGEFGLRFAELKDGALLRDARFAAARISVEAHSLLQKKIAEDYQEIHLE